MLVCSVAHSRTSWLPPSPSADLKRRRTKYVEEKYIKLHIYFWGGDAAIKLDMFVSHLGHASSNWRLSCGCSSFSEEGGVASILPFSTALVSLPEVARPSSTAAVAAAAVVVLVLIQASPTAPSPVPAVFLKRQVASFSNGNGVNSDSGSLSGDLG